MADDACGPSRSFSLGTAKGPSEHGMGKEFTMPPTDVTGSKIAMLNDTCGNLIQVTQLMRW